jgi:hypothetical protein
MQNGISGAEIPARIEGVAFAPDVKQGRSTLHTLWIANDYDFLQNAPTRNGNQIANPNQFFIVGFTEADLAGSKFVPQQFGTSAGKAAFGGRGEFLPRPHPPSRIAPTLSLNGSKPGNDGRTRAV